MNKDKSENDLDPGLVTTEESIINDLLELMGMSLSNTDQAKALIMNKATAEKIWKVGSIPVGKVYDGIITIFGMMTYYAPYLPDNVIGMLDQNYAAGYVLSVITGRVIKTREEMQKLAVKGSFIYDEIQFIGLSDSELPEWKPKIEHPAMWQPLTLASASTLDSSSKSKSISETPDL